MLYQNIKDMEYGKSMHENQWLQKGHLKYLIMIKIGWTVVTLDGKMSAHYENTILITDNEPEILT